MLMISSPNHKRTIVDTNTSDNQSKSKFSNKFSSTFILGVTD